MSWSRPWGLAHFSACAGVFPVQASRPKNVPVPLYPLALLRETSHELVASPLGTPQAQSIPLLIRRSLSRTEEVLVIRRRPCPPWTRPPRSAIDDVAARIRRARTRGASVMLTYGRTWSKTAGQCSWAN